jgi:hypothetical protein
MAEKAEEAGINSAEVELPTKEGMEAEAPPPYNPPAQTGADAQFQVNFVLTVSLETQLIIINYDSN